MRGYSKIEVFEAPELALLRYAEFTVEHYPDHFGNDRNYVRCHEVARAVAERCMLMVEKSGLALEVVDGLYGFSDHSWIHVTISRKTGHVAQVILDPYAVGRLPLVQLIYPMAVHCKLYTERSVRDDIRQDVLDHLLQINKRLGKCIGCRGLDHHPGCPEHRMCL